jgi:signal transduction protein with GAF and PtsI domain
MEKKEEIKIPWGTGIVGYVAESGEPVNIPDAYKVSAKEHRSQIYVSILLHVICPVVIMQHSFVNTHYY